MTTIEEIIVENGCVKGVISQIGHCYYAPKVILATALLQEKIHIGKISYAGGRWRAICRISFRSLSAWGLKFAGLKRDSTQSGLAFCKL